MTANEFYLWLKGYLEALETEGIETCKIERILLKMDEVKSRNQQERVVFGPNVNTPPTQQSNYAPNQPTARK
jgi:hypothetical protein